MIPISLKYTFLARDSLTIEHLSSQGKVMVWICKELEIGAEHGTVIIQGKTVATGYLPIRIMKRGTLIYPKPTSRGLCANTVVSIEMKGVQISKVVETFKCSDIERDRILFNRYYRARMFSVNPEVRTRYFRLMQELTLRHKGSM